MKILLSYIIQVNIAIVLFYLLYKILFQRDTFFYARRWFLLGAILFSFIYPFLPIDALGGLIQFQKETTVATTATVTFGTPTMMVVAEETPTTTINWINIAIILYVAVSAIFLLRFLWQFVRLVQYRGKSEVHIFNNITYRQLEHKQAPFSFFKWIFVDANLHSEEKLQQVLIHEHIHAEQWHSLDVVLSELTRIFFWWNPFVWLMKKEIVINLEYIADNGVLGEGVDRRDYQYHLLHLTYPATNLQLTNNFNVSQLKQRITMMNSEKTPIRKLAKYVLVLPVALLLITANSVYAQQTNPKKDKQDSEQLVIRGATNIKRPFYVIDDVVMGVDFDLKLIDRDDVESISVLKDETGVKIYGEEARDGVIIIGTHSKWGDKYRNDSQFKAQVDAAQLQSKNSAEPKKSEIEFTSPGSVVILDESSVSEFAVGAGNIPMVRIEKDNKGDIIISEVQDPISGKPLIIIDGVKMSKDFKLNEIKPEEIESMTILKDQSATSQYGEDGKDGVIIISKKKNDIDNTEQVEPKEMIFVVVEDQPEFPGGNQAMMDFISNNIKYPAEAKEKGIQGRVILNYVVEEDGSISEVQVVRGVDPMLDSEAIRVIESMPNWKPGKQRGKEVRVRFTLPVVFRIPAEEQVQDEEVIHIYETTKTTAPPVPTPAKFPGGDEAMFKYMAENIKYPVIALENGIQGLVEVVYNVDKNGKVSVVKFNKTIDPSLDREARRVMESMPKWEPGIVNNKPSDMTFAQSFVFRLQGDNVKEYSGETPANAVIVVGYSNN